MQFKITFELDDQGRRGFWPRSLQRGGAAGRFWSRFQELNTGPYQGSRYVSEGDREGEAADMSASRSRFPSTYERRRLAATYERRLYQDFPTAASVLLKEKLADDMDLAFNPLSGDVVQLDPASKSPERVQALGKFEVRLTRISYGSLELLLFAFGMAKLADLAGITSSDVKSYLGILAPSALNMALDTQVPLTAEVTGGDDETTPSPPTTAADQPASSMLQQGAPYFFPALLAILVMGAGAWVNSGISSQLLDERKKLTEYLNTENERLGQQRAELDKRSLDAYRALEAEMSVERSMIATKLSDLVSSTIESTRKREDAVQQANNALASQQLALIREISNDAREREGRLFDFIRSPPASVRPTVSTTPANALRRNGG
jgi:hypothetical protein